ncbi:hypothetical protein UA75_19015 [Actinoalloteichus sp. GBA129-24]|uniref:Uncharacterized protein n=2 Tax=Pseudonocardiaceae TaxID=2070 RepID=A0AAC9LDA2_9PSEU|nr:hypothetical protein UA74_18525 [Actinoalloteichus fjordicus]APU21793.1 hypothetical protein UA75_19015 [Actinoalloteichus sp. GBA129-24]
MSERPMPERTRNVSMSEGEDGVQTGGEGEGSGDRDDDGDDKDDETRVGGHAADHDERTSPQVVSTVMSFL